MEKLIEKNTDMNRQMNLFCEKSCLVESLNLTGRVAEASASIAPAISTFEQSGAPLLERIGYRPGIDASQNPKKAYI